MLRSNRVVEVQVVGAGALNQAIKALVIARGFVAPTGLDLLCRPTFAEIEIDGQRRTAIRLLVESDHGPGADRRGDRPASGTSSRVRICGLEAS